ncbi:MAG: hypothetical protein KA191_12030 [Verrucomicrobia bacterium]|nr:hypothetical protein [Verrucomicrobiota bacterium]MDI9379953.1 hypothetical protein [Verrucomicrobiota bacterium]NMD19569.1 hypothetical protein [Verrucomicrobiota bacterium]HNV00526.1 hypothetical protein [Verrucomicrobiota bacterium]HOA62912.1 hypothetical protein [Verrucomicrobiota bacterium]
MRDAIAGTRARPERAWSGFAGLALGVGRFGPARALRMQTENPNAD